MRFWFQTPRTGGFLALLALASALGCSTLRIQTFGPEGVPALESVPRARRVRDKDGFRVEVRLPKREDWQADLPLDPETPPPAIRQEDQATLITWHAGADRFAGRLGARRAYALRLQSRGETYPLGLSTQTWSGKSGVWTMAVLMSPIWVPFLVPVWLTTSPTDPRLPGFKVTGDLEWRFEPLPAGGHRLTLIPLADGGVVLLSDRLAPDLIPLGSACGYTWTLPPGKWEARPCLVFRRNERNGYYVLHAPAPGADPVMTLRMDP